MLAELQTDLGQAQETLALLYNLIQHQRESLKDGVVSEDLEAHLAAWEGIVGRIRHNAWLERSTRLNQLQEATQTLHATPLDWETTIETILDTTIRVTGAERGMLVLLENGAPQVKVMRHIAEDPFEEEDLQFSKSVVQNVLEQGQAILTSNAQLDPRFAGSESIIAYGLHSILCVPLMRQEHALGAIYLENRARSGVFTLEDRDILSSFAQQAAISLDNAYTHHQTNLELKRRVRELTMLREMARDLNARLNFERVMERSVAWAVATAEARAGALGLVAEEGVRWVAQRGELTLDTAAARRALRERQPSFTPERLLLPLLRDERPLGIFYLVADERPFTEEHLKFAGQVADNAAIAVENARLYEALLRANQAKSEFVSLVSHELRTPMTSIQGYADILKKGMVGQLLPQQEEFIEAISRNVKRMHILVSDLLDISRIETGRLKLVFQPLNLAEVVREAVRTVQEQLDKKQQLFIEEIPESLPKITADSDRLVQVLLNLLSNAIKYTPRGGTVAVRAGLSAREPGYITCSVIDTGVGITPEDQQRLFTKFFRSEDPAVREQTGTGLGLFITKSLVEMHGGRIWVESTKDKGSTFTFTLPLALPENGMPL